MVSSSIYVSTRHASWWQVMAESSVAFLRRPWCHVAMTRTFLWAGHMTFHLFGSISEHVDKHDVAAEDSSMVQAQKLTRHVWNLSRDICWQCTVSPSCKDIFHLSVLDFWLGLHWSKSFHLCLNPEFKVRICFIWWPVVVIPEQSRRARKEVGKCDSSQCEFILGLLWVMTALTMCAHFWVKKERSNNKKLPFPFKGTLSSQKFIPKLLKKSESWRESLKWVFTEH